MFCLYRCKDRGVNGIVTIIVKTESCSGCEGVGNPLGYNEGGVAVYFEVSKQKFLRLKMINLGEV